MAKALDEAVKNLGLYSAIIFICVACTRGEQAHDGALEYNVRPLHDQLAGFALSPNGDILLIAVPGAPSNELLKINLRNGHFDTFKLPNASRIYDPTFAPNGNNFAVVVCKPLGCSINIMDTQGQSIKVLSLSNQPVRHPAFSNDGQRLLYFAGASRPYGKYVDEHHLQIEFSGYYIAEYDLKNGSSSIFNQKIYDYGQKIVPIDKDNVAISAGLAMSTQQTSDNHTFWTAQRDYISSINYLNNIKFSNAFIVHRGAYVSDWPLPSVINDATTHGSTLVGLCDQRQLLIINQNQAGHYDDFGQWKSNKVGQKNSSFLACADEKSASKIDLDAAESFYDAAISLDKNYIITTSIIINRGKKGGARFLKLKNTLLKVGMF